MAIVPGSRGNKVKWIAWHAFRIERYNSG